MPSVGGEGFAPTPGLPRMRKGDAMGAGLIDQLARLARRGVAAAAAKTEAWVRAGKNQRRCKVYLHLRRIVHGGLRCTHAVATLQRALDACTGDDAGARFWPRRWSLAGGGPGQTRAPRMILRLLRAKLKRLRSQQQPSPHCACGLHVIAPPPPDAAGALDWMLSPQGNWQQRQQQADAGMAWQSMAARPSATAAACTQARRQASGCYHYHHRFHNPI